MHKKLRLIAQSAKVKAILLPGIFLQCLSTYCHAQKKVTISADSCYIVDMIKKIKQLSGSDIKFSSALFHNVPKVSLHVKNMEVEKALHKLFDGLRFSDSLQGEAIIIYREAGPDECIFKPLKGRVSDPEGTGLEAASVRVIVSGKQVLAGADGLFEVAVRGRGVNLEVTYQGYAPRTMKADNRYFNSIRLERAVLDLNEVEVIGYGVTTPKLQVGAISRVKPKAFDKQPVTNMITALEGLVPGFAIRQTNGQPESRSEISLRGQNSLIPGGNPLFIVEGIPLGNGSLSTIGSGSAQGPSGASNLNGICLDDIERIDVLKDAAATAIYGSRGANGVVLITLKKGRRGKIKWGFNLYAGRSQALKTSPLLSTPAYLDMRQDGILNDGLVVNEQTLGEKYKWPLRQTDYTRMTAGNKATVSHVDANLSGGDSLQTFFLSGSVDAHGTV